MLLYRVFPYLPIAKLNEPGHLLYVHPDQGKGRWDNADLYRAIYVASSPSGAIGEAFAHLTRWSTAMLAHPLVPGAQRSLGVYSIDEERNPLLDLDDAAMLVERSLRPTDVVIRNRPRTQDIARRVHAEKRWAGLSWWSMHRPQWTVHVLWNLQGLKFEGVEQLPAHPAVHDAARLLSKQLSRDLSTA